MFRFIRRGWPLLPAALALLALLVLAFYPSPSLAAGALVRDDTTGPYHISIWASPNPIAVGKVSLNIRLGQKGGVDQEWPVRNASITVQFKQTSGPGTENKPQVLITSNVLVAPEADPGNYEVADSLPAEGNYNVIMNINGSAGKATYIFSVYAQAQPDDRIFSIFLLVCVALFVFGLVITYLTQAKAANKAAMAEAAKIVEVKSEPEPENTKVVAGDGTGQ